MDTMETILANVGSIVVEYGMKIFIGIVILVIGLFVIKHVIKLVEKAMEKGKMDALLARFTASAIGIALKVYLAITVLDVIGVPTATFVATIGAVGIGVGFALQGSLGNLAGGILILVLRPFNVGDYISGGGNEGAVHDIHIFYTTLITHDKKLIVVPNGPLSNGAITNFTREPLRRVDLSFGVAYETDINLVKETISKVVNAHALIVNKDQTVIKLAEHGDSSINFMVLVWAKPADYLTVKFDVIEDTKLAFDDAGISIPYPHMDVNIINK